MQLLPKDIEAIERATLAAVAPPTVDAIDGWLVPYDTEVVRRAKSAVPLDHTQVRLDALDAIEERYASHGLRALFRTPLAPAFDAFHAALVGRGYRAGTFTQAHAAETRTVAGADAELAAGPPVSISPEAGDDWAAVFLGEGFDPQDGASRVRVLRRAPSLFATVHERGVAIAAGALSMSHGWASIHGMRTVQSHRGQRLATRIVASLARTACEHGFERMVLQVERDNVPARTLYARCGFTLAWDYQYWQK